MSWPKKQQKAYKFAPPSPPAENLLGKKRKPKNSNNKKTPPTTTRNMQTPTEQRKQHETESLKIRKYFELQGTIGRQTTTSKEGNRSNEQTTTTSRRRRFSYFPQISRCYGGFTASHTASQKQKRQPTTKSKDKQTRKKNKQPKGMPLSYRPVA